MSIISVSNLSKTYKLYDSPSARFKEALHPFGKKFHKDFYALNDISFEINHGDVVGIIGKNGAGKSTLLKILTGVLTQSSGSFNVNGKISALLELGGGINPEYTGIENIYFNCSLMGHSKAYIDSILQDIIDFSELGDFIHQPVKTYSSGMGVRLAFSIAVNIDPDILIVDEALSVGDIRFQQKSIRKMHELMKKAQCILFVTHDLGAIQNFCNRVIWLKDGQVFQQGAPAEICRNYQSFMAFEDSGSTTEAHHDQPFNDNSEVSFINTGSLQCYGERGATIEKVYFCDVHDHKKTISFEGNEQCALILQISIGTDIQYPIYGFTMKDSYGNQITGMNTFVYPSPVTHLKNGERIQVKMEFKLPNLKNGTYTISPAIAEGTMENHIQHHWVHDAVVFNVNSKNVVNHIGWYFVLDEVKTSVETIL